MAIEAPRGCGYRKTNGLYLVSSGEGEPCCKLPFLFEQCPSCGGGVKQSRGFTWIDPRPWLDGGCLSRNWLICPAADPAKLGERCGLLWVGERFYATPKDFNNEANTMGISRRIAAVPKGFEIGKTFVMLAHPKAVHTDDGFKPGVFRIMLPSTIEKIVTTSQARDEEAMAKLREQGIQPVVVPDDDPDHQGSVYDDAEEETHSAILTNAAAEGGACT